MAQKCVQSLLKETLYGDAVRYLVFRELYFMVTRPAVERILVEVLYDPEQVLRQVR
jgi:hypothetical protein